MPDSVMAAFSEPEDFYAAMRLEGYLALWTTAGGRFRARLSRISLGVLRLSSADEYLPRVAFVAVPSGTLQVAFSSRGATPPICAGIAAGADEIMTLYAGEQFHARTDGASHWGAIHFPIAQLVKYGADINGDALAVVPGVRRWCPPAAAARQLRGLHASAIRMAAQHPQALVDIEAAHGLEQQLLHAAVECLTDGTGGGAVAATPRDQDIMVRFERVLDNAPALPASLPEICATLQIGERDLRRLCAEHLAMSPTAYDRLRRMTLVQRALRRAEPVAESVSVVAQRHGFKDLGRFAINYRTVFGESPSDTLRRGRQRSLRISNGG